jgi:hypothetical protein
LGAKGASIPQTWFDVATLVGVPIKWYIMQERGLPAKHVAYEGKEFTIEWYHDKAGYSQAFEFAEALSDADKRKLAILFLALGDIGKIQNKEKFRYEGDKVYALKPKPHRFLSFFFEGSKVIITNAFTKKQDKLPSAEKQRALKCMKDYEHRVREGSYYGKQ